MKFIGNRLLRQFSANIKLSIEKFILGDLNLLFEFAHDPWLGLSL